MERQKVYSLIDAERRYQENMVEYADKTAQANLSVAAWIIFMEKLLLRAQDKIYDLDEQAALEFIRKATTCGVACMEHNETPSRDVKPEPFVPCFRPCGSGIGSCKECEINGEKRKKNTELRLISYYADQLGFNNPQELLDKVATWDADIVSCTWMLNQFRKHYAEMSLDAVIELVQISRQ